MMVRKIAKAFKVARIAGRGMSSGNDEYWGAKVEIVGMELPLDVHQRLSRTEVREWKWKSSRHTQSDPL